MAEQYTGRPLLKLMNQRASESVWYDSFNLMRHTSLSLTRCVTFNMGAMNQVIIIMIMYGLSMIHSYNLLI